MIDPHDDEEEELEYVEGDSKAEKDPSSDDAPPSPPVIPADGNYYNDPHYIYA